jgi:hypothetical protein
MRVRRVGKVRKVRRVGKVRKVSPHVSHPIFEG